MFTKKTRVISALCAVFMLLTMATFALPTASAETYYDEVVSATGLRDVTALPDVKNGLSAAGEYKVTDRAGMDAIAAASVTGTLEGYTFYLAADIDMGWEPFYGIGVSNSLFGGVIDGNGFVIENLYIILPSSSSSNGAALVSYAKNAAVMNLGIASGLIIGGNNAGAIFGQASDIGVINCWSAASVFGSGSDGTSGLCGRATGASTVINSYNLGLVYQFANAVTGIAGWLNGTCNFANNYNYGTLLTGYSQEDSLNNQIHGYNAIVRADFTKNRGTFTNQYFRDDCGQRSSAEAIANDVFSGLVLNDNATAKTTAEFTSLAAALNTGNPNDLGAVDGYTVEFTDSTAGYPVITYKVDGTIVVKRTAHNAFNVGPTVDWASNALFNRLFVQNASNGVPSAMIDFGGMVEIGSADDLFVLTLALANRSGTAQGLSTVKFTADIDMDDLTLASVDYYLPFGAPATFMANVDGQYHVIRHFNTYGLINNSASYNGLISIASGAVRNLGMVDCLSIIDAHNTTGNFYSYPTLLVGMNKSDADTLTIDNCFATGKVVLKKSKAANTNNNAGVLSRIMTNGAYATVTNCWADVEYEYEYNPNLNTKGRAVGSAATDANGHVVNCAYVADLMLPGNADNNASAYQDYLNTSGAIETAAVLNTRNEGAYYLTVADDGNVVFGSAENAYFTVTFVSSMGTEKMYAKVGDLVEIPALEGFAVDVESLPLGASEEFFYMPAEDVTITYTAEGVDIMAVQRLYEQYGALNPAVFNESLDLEGLIEMAEFMLENQDDVTQDMVDDLLMEADALELTLKNTYPDLPELAKRDLYASYGPSSYAITTKEDWLAAVNWKTNYSGISLHLTNDIDMENTLMGCVGFDGAPFVGTLDGHGYALYNVNIQANGQVGAIAQINSGGVVQNFGVASGTVFSTETDTNCGTGGIVGLLNGGGRIYRCWNGATVRNDTSGDICVAGIAGRGMSNSVIDNCYNIGTVIGSNSNHVAAFNDWAQTTTPSGYVMNSFNAGTLTAAAKNLVRGGSANCFENLWTTVPVNAIISAAAVSNAMQSKGTLAAEAYSNGELAYTMNSSYVSGMGEQPYYTVQDGKTVHGNMSNQTRKVTLKVTGVDGETAYYWNAGTVHELDLGVEATFEVTDGSVAALNGNILTVPSSDVEITATMIGFNTVGLAQSIARAEALNPDYFSNGAAMAARLAEAKAAYEANNFTSQEEIDAVKAALDNALNALTYAAAPNLPLATEYAAYTDAPGYMIATPADLLAVKDAPMNYTGTLYFANDIDMEGVSFNGGIPSLTASIDGCGYAILNLTMEGTNSFLPSYKGTYVGNLTFDNANTKGGYGRSLLIGDYSGGAKTVTLENLTFLNSTVTAGSGGNRMGLLLAYGGSNTETVFNIRNITIDNCKLIGEESSPMNAAFVIGQPTSATYNVTHVAVTNCEVSNLAATAGVGYVFGGIEGASTINASEIISANNITDKTGYTYGIFGQLKANATLNLSNSVIYGNQCNEVGRAQLNPGSEAAGNLVANNVYTQHAALYNSTGASEEARMLTNYEGFTTRIARTGFANGSVVYMANQGAGEEIYAQVDGEVVFKSEGDASTVCVTFVAGSQTDYFYTDNTGKLAGITQEFIDSAIWEFEGDLLTATFDVDTTINGERHEHTWSAYVGNGDGTHSRTCSGCGEVETVNCRFDSGFAYDIGSDPHTHSKTCTICGGKFTQACNDDNMVVTPATHTEAGSIQHGCSACGNIWVEAGDPATGHDYPENWTPSEENEGAAATHIKVCSANDGGMLEEACTFDEGVVVAPTYTEDGYTRHTCTVCGYYYDDEIVPMLTDIALLLDCAASGSTVNVEIALVNNTAGIAGMVIDLDYDSTVLTLTNAVSEQYMVDFDAESKSVALAAAENVVTDMGETIVTLTFAVASGSSGAYAIEATVSDATHVIPGDPEIYTDVAVVGASAEFELAGFLWADVDGSGDVSMADAVALLKLLAELIGPEDVNMAAADVDGKDGVSMADAVYLLKYLAELVPALG